VFVLWAEPGMMYAALQSAGGLLRPGRVTVAKGTWLDKRRMGLLISDVGPPMQGSSGSFP
jgi:hypothetical protein